jgi:hypothetical protein
MMESDYSGNIVIVPPEEDTIAPLVWTQPDRKKRRTVCTIESDTTQKKEL